MRSREIQLARRPVGLPTPNDFRVVETELPEPLEGQVAVRNVCMTVDPYMRARMNDRKSYVPAFELDKALTGGAIGRVISSRNPDFREGDFVESHFGWREAFVADADHVQALGDLAALPSAYLGVLGMPGLTAYAGLLEVGALKPREDTVLVSGAAGAVGSAAGQIARIKGCKIIGSAGTPEKVRHLIEDLKFDHAFDYHDGQLERQIRSLAPQGIDLYFDNVGGDHLQAALGCMRPFGRIALCGMISQYNATEPTPGPSALLNVIPLQLTLRGFLVPSFNHLREDFKRDMTHWLRSGELTYRETVVEGIERAPEALIGLFTGANTGKMIVTLE